MIPAAGRRDTLITIEQKSVTVDPVYGTQVVSWSTLGTEWAEVQDMLPSRGESVADGINIQRRPCRVRTLYRSDVNSTMRITFEGRALQIVAGPAELGRREGLEFICEEYSTEGEQA